jgi:DNA (cytosine-5)-methyltransferase 1
LKVVELFCGAGGLSLGLLNAGFDVVGAFDQWPLAVETYRCNVGDHVVEADLSKVVGIVPRILRLQPDLISAGPPCQDYSVAGRRQEGSNADLTVAFAIIVATVRPEWFIFENVVSASKSKAWTEARLILERAGYGISESRLKMEHYGVPQQRRRLVSIGRLGERHHFLEANIAAAADTHPMTLATYFQADDPSISGSAYVYCRPLRAGRGVRSTNEPFVTVTRTSWERPTRRYLSAPHPSDPVPASQALWLNTDQLSQIQGFPPNWNWGVASRHDIMQMIANAVPPPVAKRIGDVILTRAAGKTIPQVEGRFLDWLAKGERSRATARNIKANLSRAMRLLNGRTLSDPAQELAMLEAASGFEALGRATRSDLRQALKLYGEFRKEQTLRRPRLS